MLGFNKNKRNPQDAKPIGVDTQFQANPTVSQGKVPPTQSVLEEDEDEVELTESKVDWNPRPKRMGFLKTIAPVILILSVAGFGIAYFMRSDKKVTQGPPLPPVPSIPPFQRFQPSIYADDPVILKLQEDVNVLDRELSNTQIKETILEPPTLDFNVTFK